MLQVPPPESLHSSPTKAIIQTSLYTQNVAAHPLVPENSKLTLVNSIKNSRNKSPLHSVTTNSQLTLSNLWLWTSRLGTNSTSMLNSYTPLPSWKLSNKNVGPYEIIAKPGTHSFTLQLLDSHPSCLSGIAAGTCILKLHPWLSTNYTTSSPHWGQPEFEILEILNSKVDCHWCICKLLYLVCWSRYEGTNEETSWILTSELGNVSKLVEEFHWACPLKPGPLSDM